MRAIPIAVVALAALIVGASCAVEGSDVSARRGAEPVPPLFAGAAVSIPRVASEPFEVRAHGMRLGVSWVGASAAPADDARDGRATYRGALSGADAEVTWTERGFEDSIRFVERPAERAVRYAIDLDGVAGLRLVDDVLELLDEEGTPRLRMSRAWVDDGATRVRAHTSIEGCAYSTDGRAPWGEPVVPPGSRRCTVTVRWDDEALVYPATLDPIWGSTYDMSAARIDSLDRLRLVVIQNGSHKGKVFVAGGTDLAIAGGTILDAADMFDPISETWSALNPLPFPRRGPITAYVDAPSGPAILVAGGCLSPCNAQPTSWLYDIASGDYTQVGDLGSPRAVPFIMSRPDGKILVTGGGGLSNQPIPVTTEIFDPATGQWSFAAPRLSGRVWGASAVLADGRFIVGGGRDFIAPGVLDTAEVYDPVADTWTPTQPMKLERFFFDFIPLADGRVIGVGGEQQQAYLTEVELYDPVTNAFSLTGEMDEGVVSHATETLANGFIASIAGYGTATIQLFDPVTHQWSLATPLPDLWWEAAHVRLLDGRILLAGGVLDAEWPSATNRSMILSTEDDGEACVANGECTSGHCVDGVCCDTACDAACSACSAAKKGGGADGVCGVASIGAPDPRELCGDASHTCGATGLCAAGGTCALVAPGEACFGCPVNQAGSCDGAGVCVCTGPHCVDAHTLQTTDGPVVDCSPYLCAEDDCRHACNTSTECAEGYLCDATHACIFEGAPDPGPPTPAPLTDDGCSCSSSGARGSGGAAVLVAAGILGLRRLRRARSRVRRVP